LTPLVRSLAHRNGLVAQPHRDRWHPDPIPVLGGLAIAAAFFTTVAISAPLGPLVPLLIGAGAMFALGALDDLLHFGAATKLAAQTIIAAVVVFLMPPAPIFGLAPIDQLLAVFWMVGITNAFNLLDNIDGLSAGIATIAGIFLLAALGSDTTPVSLAVSAFIGAALGFLIYNVRPASIFMGDSGSLFLGSFLGGAALLAAPGLKTNVAPVAAIPLFILLVPIFDTAFVSVTRRLAGRSPLVGGRDHLSHRLVALGMDERWAVIALYLLAAVGGVTALSLQHADVAWAGILIAVYLLVLGAFGIVLGNVESHTADADRPLPPLVSEVAYRNRIIEVVLDLALIALAYYAAFRFKFRDAVEFRHFLPYFATSFPLVIACQLAGLALAGKYRQTWRNLGATELVGILRGIGFGFAGSALLILFMYRFVGFSRLVFVIEAVLLVFLLVGARLLITSVDEYIRARRGAGRRVLIYGAGVQGRLLVRALLEDRSFGLVPIGFIDDDGRKRRVRVEGVPIIGTFADLPDILDTRRVAEVLISTKAIDRTRVAEAAAVCREREVLIRAMRFTLEDIGPIPVPTIRHVQGR
jgi:UDP-GlcNAc:undecaprenyl-phosphate/decaprenyl-phosphate GlcNAc-1-phosphate transferase